MMYDELIKRLRKTSMNLGEMDTVSVLLLDAANAIEELSKKMESACWGCKCEKIEQTSWISVAERLPNCNGCYLVWRPHFFGGEIGMPSICYFDGSNTWHDSYGVDFTRTLHPEDVTYWMPLPEPPKADKDGA